MEQKVVAVVTAHRGRASALLVSTTLQYTMVKLYSWSVSAHQHNKPSMHCVDNHYNEA